MDRCSWKRRTLVTKYLNTFKYYEILKTLKQKEIQTKEARLLLLSGPLQRDRCFLLPNLFPRKLWLLVSVIMCHSTSQKVSKDTLKLKLPTFVCNTAVPLSVREQDAICRPTNPNSWTAFDSAPSFSCRLQSYQELHQSFHPDVLAVDICWLKRSQFDSKLNIDCWQPAVTKRQHLEPAPPVVAPEEGGPPVGPGSTVGLECITDPTAWLKRPSLPSKNREEFARLWHAVTSGKWQIALPLLASVKGLQRPGLGLTLFPQTGFAKKKI